jgi:hypothetical protein
VSEEKNPTKEAEFHFQGHTGQRGKQVLEEMRGIMESGTGNWGPSENSGVHRNLE